MLGKSIGTQLCLRNDDASYPLICLRRCISGVELGQCKNHPFHESPRRAVCWDFCVL